MGSKNWAGIEDTDYKINGRSMLHRFYKERENGNTTGQGTGKNGEYSKKAKLD